MFLTLILEKQIQTATAAAVNQTNNSPQSLPRLEINRQMRDALNV